MNSCTASGHVRKLAAGEAFAGRTQSLRGGGIERPDFVKEINSSTLQTERVKEVVEDIARRRRFVSNRGSQNKKPGDY